MKKDIFLKMVIIGLLLINLGTLGFLVISSHHHGPPFGPHHSPADFLTRQLGLTLDQEKAFRDLARQHHEAMVKEQDAIRDFRHRLYSEDKSGSSTLFDSIAARQKQIEQITFTHFQQVRALCSDEQKKRFDAVLGEMVEHVTGPHPPGPPPHE